MTRYIGRREYFGSVWYDHEKLEYVFCDQEATKMLTQGKLGKVHPACGDRLTSFFDNGYRILDTRPSVNNVLSAPLQVYYDFTTVCNLRCLHCYTDSGDMGKELGLDTIVKWADELAQNGVFKISLGGGEPLLHPNCLAIIDLFRDRGIAVSISTNGIPLSKSMTIELAAKKLRTISLSMEGGNKAEYETVRGQGTWDKLLAGLDSLKRFYPHRYAIRVTVTNQTLNNVKDIIHLAKAFDVSVVKFKFLQMSGRTKDNLCIVPDSNEALSKVAEAIKIGDKLGVKVSVPHLCHLGEVTHSINRYRFISVDGSHPFETQFGCGGGRTGLYVYPDGRFSACASMGKNYETGKVTDFDLRRHWEGGTGFALMRSILGNSICLDCPDLDRCHGGCRARALSWPWICND